MCLEFEIVKASDFLKTRKTREEKWSSVVIVAGVKSIVMAYDVWQKTHHEVFVVIRLVEGEFVIRIPEILIQKESSRIEEVVRRVLDVTGFAEA
jgi:ABC-type proline/glycine betaine transport system permease subunit